MSERGLFSDVYFVERTLNIVLSNDLSGRRELFRLAQSNDSEKLSELVSRNGTPESPEARLRFLRFLYGMEKEQFLLDPCCSYMVCSCLAKFLLERSSAKDLNTLKFLLKKFSLMPQNYLEHFMLGNPVLVELRHGFENLWTLYAALFSNYWLDFKTNGFLNLKSSPVGKAQASDQIQKAFKFLVSKKLVDISYRAQDVPNLSEDTDRTQRMKGNFWRIFFNCFEELPASADTLDQLHAKGYEMKASYSTNLSINVEFADEFADQLGLSGEGKHNFLKGNNVAYNGGLFGKSLLFLELD